MASVLFLVGATAWYYISKRDEVSTRWHDEELTSENVTFEQPFTYSSETLQVKEHSWKIIGPTPRGHFYNWGFKCVIHFPVDRSDVGSESEPWKDDPIFIQIESLTYRLFDRDGFELESLVLDESNMGVLEGTSQTFQESGVIDKSLAARAAVGKLSVNTDSPRGTLGALMRIKRAPENSPIPQRSEPLDLDYLDKLEPTDDTSADPE